jgi:1,4-dihydroxy-6-naphthoate synthase
MSSINAPLTLGISPCPNDTFIFDAWVNGRLGPDTPAVAARLEDIDTLNTLAVQSALDVVKVSFFAYGLLRERYQLLQAGGALGRGCGPLLVSRNARLNRQDLANAKLRVAVPGELTTAHLLLRLYQPAACTVLSLPFEQIMPAIAQGDIDAGVIIHEGRFTYHQYGLHMLVDLGAWWEQTTGHPIPLGCIVARSSLGPDIITSLERTIRASLLHARRNPEASREYIHLHAQELDPKVITEHIELYVNHFTENYGREGLAAIACLLDRASDGGLFQQ